MSGAREMGNLYTETQQAASGEPTWKLRWQAHQAWREYDQCPSDPAQVRAFIVAAQGASRRIAVFGYALQGGGTVTAKFTDGTGGTQLSMAWSFAVREHTENPPGRYPLWIGAANTALILNLSGAIAVGCEVTYLVIG